jgi:hypothetical protein
VTIKDEALSSGTEGRVWETRMLTKVKIVKTWGSGWVHLMNMRRLRR